MDPASLRVVNELYRALDERDAAALFALLAEDFEGEVTRGLPEGLGGVCRGREAMMGVWAGVARLLDVRPKPREMVGTDDGRIVVMGHYVGRARATGKELNAAFVHVLRVEGDRLRGLVQVTDSGLWREALS
jgi:ketosteroid isomerase-like protein